MCHATVRVPEGLRGLVGGNGEVMVDGSTAGEALASLFGVYDDVIDHVTDGTGRLLPHMQLLLGATDVQELCGLSSRLRNGDVLTLVDRREVRQGVPRAAG